VLVRALLLALLCLLPALPTLPTLAQTDTPPDIIVVLLDDARADEIARALPQTRDLLTDGTVFPNFIVTTPMCCPSRATDLTGRYAHNTGVLRNIGRNGGRRAFRPREDETIAVALDAAGYRTALVGKYLNGYARTQLQPPGWDLFDATDELSYRWHGGYVTDVQRKIALDFIADAGADPVFLWFSAKAPHDPSVPAARHRDSFPDVSGKKGDRLRSLLAVDEAVVAIAAALGPERTGRALWLVLSDNGFLLGEHGMRGKGVWWDQAVRVSPLIRGPGLGSGEDRRLAATIDVAPTIARAAGVTLPVVPDGRALQDAWDRERVFVEGWPNSDEPGVSWAGVKTKDELYLERRGDPPVLYTLADGEARPQPLPDVDAWAVLLDALRECAGKACRDADGG
jgi:N-acetylglucosamine-6-sulfatase